MDATTLRVIDFGSVSPLRSQTLWHAIARGVSAGAPPTLSFMRPDAPYVSIGYHRRLDEVDREECRRRGLPVFRRMVGGGPVYIDAGQHFFQIIVPLSMADAVRSEAVRSLLEPAVRAFKDVGVPASLDDANEVVVADRKICGHAAGQIDQAVVVVGNLINTFDHAAAARIVNAPSRVAQDEFLAQMRRYVAPTSADPKRFFRALATRYGEGLGLAPVAGELSGYEESALTELDGRFADPEWVGGMRKENGSIWRAKVKSGVWVGSAAVNGHRVTATFHGSEAQAIRLEGAESPFEGMAELIQEMAANPPV